MHIMHKLATRWNNRLKYYILFFQEHSDYIEGITLAKYTNFLIAYQGICDGQKNVSIVLSNNVS